MIGASPLAYAQTPIEKRIKVGNVAANSAPLPADVISFTLQRDECDHFRGEEAYDAEREADISFKLKETCTGTDKALANLRKKYADQQSIFETLKKYEDNIE